MKDGAYWLKSHCGWAVVQEGQIVRVVKLAGIGLYRGVHGLTASRGARLSQDDIAREAAALAQAPEGIAE